MDAALDRCSSWNTLSFNTDDRQFSLAMLVDNLLSTGSSPEAAVAILEDCGKHLAQHWGLRFGEDIQLQSMIPCSANQHLGALAISLMMTPASDRASSIAGLPCGDVFSDIILLV